MRSPTLTFSMQWNGDLCDLGSCVGQLVNGLLDQRVHLGVRIGLAESLLENGYLDPFKAALAQLRWNVIKKEKRAWSVNPKKTGGGGLLGPPLPRHFARLFCNAQSSRRDTLWLFSFKFPAHFDTKFVMPGGTVLKLRNFLYMHVGPKMAPKCDFVYKINANWVFSHSSYKYAYFYSQWLKWIRFSIIVLQKVSATNFTEKNNKNKR